MMTTPVNGGVLYFMSRKLISKLIALCVGLFCVFIAYNSNSNKTYSISGNAYGTSWSVVSTSFIADHHEKNIIKIITTETNYLLLFSRTNFLQDEKEHLVLVGQYCFHHPKFPH